MEMRTLNDETKQELRAGQHELRAEIRTLGEAPILVADYVLVEQGSDWLISAGRIATKPPTRGR
jgi:hypothetical protein